MRTTIIVLFILCSTLIQAQNKVITPAVEITFNEQSAVVTQTMSAKAAIGVLVDKVRLSDFTLVDDGIKEYTVYQGDVSQNGFDAVWWIYLDPVEGYCPMYLDDYIGQQQFFKSLADCKKVMKAEMQMFYQQYGSLDPER